MFLVPVSRYANQDTRQLSRLFDDTLERFFGPVSTASESVASRAPALDVAETDRAYTVKLEVPGVTKDDVKVSVEGRQVTVQASTQRVEEKKEGERLVYRERAATSYARTFTLPVEVDQAEAGARLEHGVLTLTLPKRSARSAAQIAVN
jgi:HSP20 family protein